jgi:hypothetical protein
MCMQAKLKAAVKAAEQFNAEAVETDERKRKYNAAASGSANGDAEPTPGGDGLCQVAAPDWGQWELSIGSVGCLQSVTFALLTDLP